MGPEDDFALESFYRRGDLVGNELSRQLFGRDIAAAAAPRPIDAYDAITGASEPYSPTFPVIRRLQPAGASVHAAVYHDVRSCEIGVSRDNDVGVNAIRPKGAGCFG
jgi:hypothetical protein